MTETRHDKLVRDNIPAIIEAKGRVAVTRTLGGAALRRSLADKLCEEAAEFRMTPCAEELADVLEVLEAAAAAHGISMDEVLRARAEKARVNGVFSRRVFLEKVIG